MAKKGYFSAKNVAWRELPSGYTQVTHIEATGTQYINSDIIGRSGLEIRANLEFTEVGSDTQIFIGSMKASSDRIYPFSTGPYIGYGSYVKIPFKPSANVRYTVYCKLHAGEQILTINGETIYTGTNASTYNSECPMYLFAGNKEGTADYKCKIKIIDCQIYVNGALVRDYVSSISPSGEVGLYDMVDGVFYGNAGTGSFLAGDEVHSYVAREPKKVYFSDNGVARKAKKAYYGDENGIARLCYQRSMPISTIAVGESVYMSVGGVRTEFLVVHQGIPDSALYDSSCNGTWLLTKNIYSKNVFDGTNHDYENSDIHNYLNDTFVNLFDSDIKSVIKQVKIPYRKGSGTSTTATSGANGLSAKAFLLSLAEIGCSSRFAPVEGAVLSYFDGADFPERVAEYNGDEYCWWLRSPYTDYTSYAWRVGNDNSEDYDMNCNGYVKNAYGVRPSIILPSDTLVNTDYNVIG